MNICGPNTIAIGGKTGSIEIYDIFSGNLIWSKTEAHSGPIWSMDVGSNFLLMATGGSDGILKIWEFESKEIFLIKQLLYKDQILATRLIPKNDVVVICGISPTVSVFFLKSLQFSFSLHGHTLPVISIGVCDNFDIIGTGSVDFSVRIWSLKEKKVLKSLIPDFNAITSISFLRNSKNFFTGSRKGSIQFWNGDNFSLLSEVENFHEGAIWVMKSSESGNFLASGSQDKFLVIWELQKKSGNQFNQNVKKKGEFLKFKKQKRQTVIKDVENRKEYQADQVLKKIQILKRKILKEKQKVPFYPLFDRCLKGFGNLSQKEMKFLTGSIENEELLFFFEKILKDSINNLIVDPVSILDQLESFFKSSREQKNNYTKNLIFRSFEKKIKKILKGFKEEGGYNLERLKSLYKNKKINLSDLPDSN
mmetsp:Transcript_13611/g.27198  ORF Transcript_13611/g.27198 Transcript_13611/m.27198 type:complete len:421 (-) Transcript_13611:1806-3068(-)